MTSQHWPAPYADRPVDAVVDVPASKSLTNRVLVLAAIAEGPTVVRNPLVARDTSLMLAGLAALGVGIESSDDRVRVIPRPLRGPAAVDCGLAGTVMRFLPPVAALADGRIDFDGDPRSRTRPMGELLGALRSIGVALSPAARTLPFILDGTGSVKGGAVTVDASASSQFVSGLLLAGARYEHGIDVRHDGKPIPSLPHVEMTVAALRERGVRVDDAEPDRWVVHPGPVAAIDAVVEPDLSTAAPFLAAAAVTGGEVSVRGWPATTHQPGDQLRWILGAFGAQVELTGDVLRVRGRDRVSAVDLDLHDAGELTPVVAAICAFGDGSSRIRGIAHLRGHETDRLAALTAELQARGTDVEETPDGLVIRPLALRAGVFHTYNDHRMAHAGAVIGLRVRGLEVENIATTSKSFPGFAPAWSAMFE